MRPDLLLWLAESHRRFLIAGPGLSESMARDLRAADPRMRCIAYEDVALRYEPRSMARSPDGTKVIVGTKAGFLHLVHWNGSRWHSQSEWKLEDSHGNAIPRSIRAVRFLNNHTVVAGWGEGVFGVFDAETLINPELTLAEPANDSDESDRRRREWLGRFARFISLAPPSAPLRHRVSAVMLGVTIGSQVHVLVRDGESYFAKTYLPEQILPELPVGARIVDGVWAHNFLWILDSSGYIYRCAPAEPSPPASVPLVIERKFFLKHPREIGEFRAIASCVMGLAVLASDDITFLRFSMPAEGSDVPSIDPVTALWVAVPSAIDCSVCLPFPQNYQEGPLACQKVKSGNPVWTVVGTSGAGLRWIQWRDSEAGSTVRLPAVSHSHRAGSGDSSVLQVRFGFLGDREATYIACATRDHRLRLATIIDRKATLELLSQEIPRALEKSPLIEQESGIAWWLLDRRICSDFDPRSAVEATAGKEPRRLLRFTEREDLYRLVRLVLAQWLDSSLDGQVRGDLVRDWMCHILVRAYQLEQSLAQQLARLAHDRIAQMRGKSGGVGRRVEQELGLFAAFIRKWVVYGHTYGEKTHGFLELYAWNRSGHVLDALTYLTKLLRNRVDPLWDMHAASRMPVPGIWDLVAPPSGDFSIHSSTDGRITAVGEDGQILAWRPADSTYGQLADHCLEIWQDQLSHTLANDFLAHFRHGPYARSLLLLRASEDEEGAHLLVFCFRGWRRESPSETGDDRKPRLYALLAQRETSSIRILAVDSRPLPGEIYGLCELKSLQQGRRHVLVAGTRGAWKAEDRWEARPFIEISVDIKDDGSVHLDVEQQTSIMTNTRGERSIFKTLAANVTDAETMPETAYNPCWSLCTFTSSQGHLWLWAGFHDGQIRCFLRVEDTSGSQWVEGGASEGESDQGTGATDRDAGLATSAPVWRLHVLAEQGVLAYGLADGIIGAVPFDEEKGRLPPLRPHLIHHREASPVCGLLSYTDSEGGTRLLAVTQGGVVNIFDLDLRNPRRRTGSRPTLPGLTLDRFALGHECRAVAIVDYAGRPHRDLLAGPLSAIVFGSNEGGLFKHALALPRGTPRRQKAFREWCSDLLKDREATSIDGTRQPPPAALFVGDNSVHRWLRVLDVRGVHLLRFSIAQELRMRWPEEELSTLAERRHLEEYLAVLNDLADDVYDRVPLTPEPAKVIWEEAARVANRLAAMALEKEPGEESESLLEAYLHLNRTIDDLCNRWIGSPQAVESRVLMHSFNCLFDWVGIALIGLAIPSPKVLAARSFLLHNIIQRRLGFNDRLVNLETLRTLNIATMRTILKAQAATNPPWSLSLRPQLESLGETGLFDLLTMVGDLGEQQAESLVPFNPLWTELAKFFAATLILLPRCSFVISQVIAESRLTERDTRFARTVEVQAKQILSHLGLDLSEERQLALRQFADSFDDKIDETIRRPLGLEVERGTPAVSEAWQRLLQEGGRDL